MKLFDFGSLFGAGHDTSKEPKDVSHRIVEHLFGLVQDKTQVTEVLSSYNELSRRPSEKVLPQLIGMYTALERYITEQAPPVVSQKLTSQEIRSRIAGAFPIAEAPDEFRLIFEPENEQALLLCAHGSHELITFLSGSMGITPVQTIYQQVVGGTFLKDTTITQNGIDLSAARAAAATTPLKDIVSAFKVINASLFQEIITVLGDKSALELIQRMYAAVKERYDPDLIALFLDSMPLGVLESERATFLSKEELGRKIEERTAELVAAQQELRAERDRAKAIISSIGEGLLTLDSEFRITSLNGAAERILGLSASQVTGAPWNTAITVLKHSEEDVTESFLSTSLTDNEITSTGLADDLSFRTASRTFPVGTIVTPLSRKGVHGAVIVFRDITAEKEANAVIERTVAERTQEVQEGRARLLASINSLKLGFIMTDHDLTVTIVNKMAEEILPQLKDKVAGEFTLTEISLLFGESINLEKTAREVTATQEAVAVEGILQGTQYLRIYASPIVHRDETIGCAILIEDVTEARVLARSRDEFFTIASHELRTPLIAIRGYASMIKESFPAKIGEPDVLRMVDRIDMSGQRLINIVNSFLDMSRLEQGKMDVHVEEFDFDELVQRCIDELSHMAADKGIAVTYATRPSVATISADKNLTKQVLYNLIGNGIKFTSAGEVRVDAESSESGLAVTVSDTGIGIPPEAQALLFRKFQQTGDSLFTRDNSQGTGLGLYISKLIMERMGGSLSLKSSSESGSVFSFTIPKNS